MITINVVAQSLNEAIRRKSQKNDDGFVLVEDDMPVLNKQHFVNTVNGAKEHVEGIRGLLRDLVPGLEIKSSMRNVNLALTAGFVVGGIACGSVNTVIAVGGSPVVCIASTITA